MFKLLACKSRQGRHASNIIFHKQVPYFYFSFIQISMENPKVICALFQIQIVEASLN